MSVCRFWWEGSDVYVFYHVGDYWTCCGCWLGPPDWKYHGDYDETAPVVEHLKKHVQVGHVVPVEAFERLGAEHPDPDPALKAKRKWREEHYEEYGFMWDRDHPAWEDVDGQG